MWCRLSDLPFPAKELLPDLWRVGPNAYVTTGPWTEGWRPAIDGPHIFSIRWACSDEVMESLAGSGPVPESLVVPVAPPAALILGGIPTFASIRKAIGRQGDGEEAESADLEGRFLCRELRSGRFGYCFRSEIEYSSEMPFAINVTPV